MCAPCLELNIVVVVSLVAVRFVLFLFCHRVCCGLVPTMNIGGTTYIVFVVGSMMESVESLE